MSIAESRTDQLYWGRKQSSVAGRCWGASTRFASLEAAVTTAEIAWRRFTETFGEAIALHWEHGDRDTVIELIRRSRELLHDYYDELSRGRTPAEQAFPLAVETFANQLEQMEIEIMGEEIAKDPPEAQDALRSALATMRTRLAELERDVRTARH